MKRIGLAILCLPIFLLTVALWRVVSSPDLSLEIEPVLETQPAARFRVMTLNTAHGRRLSFNQAFLSRDAIATNLVEVVRVTSREEPDVLALQETDGASVWSGHFDHVRSLAGATGMAHTFRGSHGRGIWPFVLDYGTALVSKLPLTQTASQSFDESWRDNKGFVVATVQPESLEGLAVDVVSVHLDFARREIRERQIDVMVEFLAERKRPIVLMGDLNCTSAEKSCVSGLTRRLGLHAHDLEGGEETFSSDDPRVRIDWILISNELGFESYETLTDQVSDHRGVVAEIVLESH